MESSCTEIGLGCSIAAGDRDMDSRTLTSTCLLTSWPTGLILFFITFNGAFQLMVKIMFFLEFIILKSVQFIADLC